MSLVFVILVYTLCIMTEQLHEQTGNYKVIPHDDMFQTELSAAGVKLVIVDFFATW